MARKRDVKAFEQKQRHIIDETILLIMKYGLESFSLNELLRNIDMSKGVFFHYFKSKDDLLNKVVEYSGIPIVNNMQEIVLMKSISAKEKLKLFYETSSNHKMTAEETAAVTLYSVINRSFIDKITESVMEDCKNFFKKVITDGVSEGIFRVTDIDGSVYYLLELTLSTNEAMSDFFLDQDINRNKSKLLKKIEIFEILVETLLGCSDIGSLYDLSIII